MSKSNKAAAKAAETKEPVEVQVEATAAVAEPAAPAEAIEPEAETASEADATPAAEPETAKQAEATAASKPAARPSTRPAASRKPAYPAFLESYVKAYPNEKVFHVTSDRQVFLDKDYHMAKVHQRSLGKGEITTYNI